MFIILSLLLLFLHGVFIEHPIATMDEAAFVDYALHGKVLRWLAAFPPRSRFLGDYYGFGGCPFHIAVLRVLLRWFGPGLWQSRFPSLMAGWLALGIILWMLHRLRSSRWVITGVASFGLSYLYFLSIHSVRPDAFILLSLTLNVAWLVLEPAMWISLPMGWIAAGALGFHPAGLFTLLLIPLVGLIHEGKNIVRQPRFYGWLMGAIIGFYYVQSSVNLDSVAVSWNIASRVGFISPIPLLHGNPWLPFCHFILFVSTKFQYQNALWPLLNATLFSSLCLQYRHRSQLGHTEKQLLDISLLLPLIYCFTTASSTRSYLVYIYPWMLLQMFLVVEHVYREDYEVSREDLMGVALIGITIGGSAYLLPRVSSFAFGAVAWALIGLIYLYFRMARYISKRLVFLSSTACLMYFLVYLATFPNTIPINVGWFIKFWQVSPVTFLLWVVITAGSFSGSLWKRIQIELAIPRILVVLYLSFLILDLRAIAVYQIHADLEPSLNQMMQFISHDKRILGPLALSLYEPQSPVHSIEATLFGENFGISSRESLIAYSTTAILWPESDRQKLVPLMETFPEDFHWIRIFNTPLGNYAYIQFQKKSKTR
jgi:hypothetical protein